MQVTCQECERTLDFSGEKPSFCAYCGRRFSTVELDRTVDFHPESTPRGSTPHGVDQDDVTWTPHNTRGVALSVMPAAVGGYKLRRALGTGGMGTVYEAEDSQSGRTVAVKLISSEVAVSADAVERFRQEGRLASSISHPRCVFVIGADEEQGRPYIVMELMTGSTLKELVEKNGPLRPQQAIPKILDVIDGLIEAHQLGVVHRDVKPSNCFLEPDGRVKIGDFGLAKSLMSNGHMTRTGQFLGTPLFASPEQIRGEEVDQQSDVYSVAATLYYLLTGQAPFEHSDAAATLARIVSQPPPPMRSLRPEIPPALDRAVLRGLERDRGSRFRTLEEFREALVPFIPGQLSIGTLGLRVGAFVIDWLIFIAFEVAIKGLVAGLLSTPLPSGLFGRGLLPGVLAAIPWLGYFIWLESQWGCSLGKRIFRLRVNRVDGGGPPTLGETVRRTLVFYAITLFLPHVLEIIFAFGNLPDVSAVQALQALPQLLPMGGVIILAMTMRAKNGFQAMHDVVTATRVVRLPWPKPRRTYPNLSLDRELARPEGMWEELGPYEVTGALKWLPEERLVQGRDAALGRRVWIWARPQSAPNLGHARRETSRGTRLRWLGGGGVEGWQWDAFFAPQGSRLPEVIATRGRLPWADARLILEQLVDELVIAAEDGTLPGSLSPEQIWIQPNGRIYLLAVQPYADAPATYRTGGTTDAHNAVDFVRQAARLLLEGKSEDPAHAQRPIRAPVPLHAREILDRLIASPERYKRVDEVQADLAQTRGLPTEIDTRTRAGHLVVLGALVFFGLAAGFALSRFYAIWSSIVLDYHIVSGKALVMVLNDPHGRAQLFAEMEQPPSDAEALRLRDAVDRRVARDEVLLRQRIEQLDAVQQSTIRVALQSQLLDFAGAGERPLDLHYNDGDGFQIVAKRCSACGCFEQEIGFTDHELRMAIDHLKRPQRDYEAGVVSVVLTFFTLIPGVWVLWAFAFRGGLSYRILGVSLLRKSGRPALRFQCAFRALLVWGPIFGLLALSVYVEAFFWQPSWLPAFFWWSALGLLVLYAIHALRAAAKPGRPLHDHLAGTYLAPR